MKYLSPCKDVSTGRFLEKSAKLILRELQKSNFFGLSFKGLGIYKFRLGQLAAQLGMYAKVNDCNFICLYNLNYFYFVFRVWTKQDADLGTSIYYYYATL